MMLSCIFVLMEVIKDILINLAANAVWAIGGILLIYFIQLKKLYSCRYYNTPVIFLVIHIGG